MAKIKQEQLKDIHKLNSYIIETQHLLNVCNGEIEDTDIQIRSVAEEIENVEFAILDKKT